MNKFYIPLLSVMLCIQQAQSMEQLQITTTIPKNEYCRILSESGSFNTTERFIHVTSVRYKDSGSFILKQTVDLLSLKLYNRNLNEKGIEELAKQGADVNYREPDFLYYNGGTIAMFHVMDETEQGIKNMAKLIALGANLHYFDDTLHTTPFGRAVQRKNIPMIKLLLPYEKIETPTYREQKARAAVIYHSINDNSFEVVKMLLELKLMTPNQGLEELIRLNQPNEELLNCLIDNGANNQCDHLNEVADKAFSDKSIQLLNLLSKRGAFDKDVLAKMLSIKTLVDSTINNLETNQTK